MSDEEPNRAHDGSLLVSVGAFADPPVVADVVTVYDPDADRAVVATVARVNRALGIVYLTVDED